ncbi:MAG: hypothetical protein SF069_12530 [Phycisphaerae bacterium]|nr:hypothetical protein [Phycisphaerae bacterium]
MKRFQPRLATFSLALIGASLANFGGCPQPAPSDDGQSNGPPIVGNPDGNGNGGGGGGGNGGGGGGGGGTLDRSLLVRPSSPTLFVTEGIRGVMTFANANTINGNIAPTAFIANRSLVQTGIAAPEGVCVDRTGTLIVYDGSVPSLVLYQNAAAAVNDRAPTREITGAGTKLARFAPDGLAVDRVNDRVFVAAGDRIMMFEGADLSKNGDTPPTRFFSSAALPGAGAIALGPNGDLYVSNDDDQVLVFNAAATRSGAISPDRVISLTGYRTDGVFVDAEDRLYVSDFDRIAVMDNAAALNGLVNTFSEMRVQGVQAEDSSGLRQVCIVALAVDSRGIGYACDRCNGAVYMIDGIARKTGDVTPNRAITGGNTRLPAPTAIFLWE